jgi:hypothetical protein
VDARIAGVREALARRGSEPSAGWVRIGEMNDRAFVRNLTTAPLPDAFLCCERPHRRAPAAGAARRPRALCPRKVRVVGFDDVKFATSFRRRSPPRSNRAATSPSPHSAQCSTARPTPLCRAATSRSPPPRGAGFLRRISFAPLSGGTKRPLHDTACELKLQFSRSSKTHAAPAWSRAFPVVETKVISPGANSDRLHVSNPSGIFTTPWM